MNEPQLITPLDLMREVARACSVPRDRISGARCTWDNFPAHLCHLQILIGELVDALHEMQGSNRLIDSVKVTMKQCHVAICTVQMLQDLAPDEWTVRERFHGVAVGPANALQVVEPMRRYWVYAARSWEEGQRRDALISLEILLSACAASYGGGWESLGEVCLAKIEHDSGCRDVLEVHSDRNV